MSQENAIFWIDRAKEAVTAKEWGRARECLTIAGELSKSEEVAERVATEILEVANDPA